MTAAAASGAPGASIRTLAGNLGQWAAPVYVAIVWASLPKSIYGGLPSPVEAGGVVLLLVAAARLPRRPGIAVPALLIVGLIGLAALSSGVLSSEATTFPTEWLAALAFVFMIAYLIDGRAGADRTAIALCVAAVFLGCGAGYSVLVGPTQIFPLNEGVEGLEAARAAGPFGEANFFALSLATLVPLAVYLIVGRGPRRVLGAVALCSLAAGILSTGSRGGLIAALAALVGGCLLLGGRRLGWLLLVSVVAAGLSLPFAAQLGSAEERPVSGRTTENLIAVEMFLDRPLTGVGAGNFPLLYRDYAREVGNDPRPVREPHSLPLEIAAEQGVAGIAAWIVAMIVLIRFIRARAIWQLAIGRALVLALGTYAVGSLFLQAGHLRLLFILVAVVLALGGSREAMRAAATSPSPRRRPVTE